ARNSELGPPRPELSFEQQECLGRRPTPPPPLLMCLHPRSWSLSNLWPPCPTSGHGGWSDAWFGQGPNCLRTQGTWPQPVPAHRLFGAIEQTRCRGEGGISRRRNCMRSPREDRAGPLSKSQPPAANDLGGTRRAATSCAA